ncbi:MAG: hypothetical protein ACE5MM_03115 [Nitrospiraceae bacterium]
MRPTDAGLCAITEAWLGTYRKLLETAPALDKGALRRLDPVPRLEVLAEAGVVAPDHSGAVALREAFQRALDNVHSYISKP